MKPDGYPLPWCEALDVPYWKLNAMLCFTKPGWREWQGKLNMDEIIPEIDRIIEKGL